MRRKAIVLLSGGLDSAVTLALAREEFSCFCLTADYGQRHRVELDAAPRVARALGADEHKVFEIDFSMFRGSALTDQNIAVPLAPSEGIPVTYVPARNTIFLSLALAYAEVRDANDIFIGANAIDYSGYPDCRPEYIAAFQNMANLATKSAIEGRPIKIHAPLINLSKAEIIRRGTELKVDFGLTVSCYQATKQGAACGMCDACRLRAEGFRQAGISDPTRYAPSIAG
ncbi:MAG: 7-cyano-7-deazaguanine synthase QueC [Burkholderiales bacterium]